MYKISSNGLGVLRQSDMAYIPLAVGNADYVGYLTWLAEGNIPEPEFTQEQLNDATKLAIASRRFDAETRGMTINGLPVYTDRTTQMKLTAASVRSARDPAYTVDWKLTDNSFVTLNAAELIGVGDAIGDYVQACYTRESVLLIALANGIYTDAMLQAGWPE